VVQTAGRCCSSRGRSSSSAHSTDWLERKTHSRRSSGRLRIHLHTQTLAVVEHAQYRTELRLRTARAMPR
jgi:hypothetical protein